MKISGNKPPDGTDLVRLEKAERKGNARPAGKPAGGDTVDLSVKARELGDLVSEAMGLPDVRTGKVAALKDRIASGKYAVDPAKVAKKMIDEIA